MMQLFDSIFIEQDLFIIITMLVILICVIAIVIEAIRDNIQGKKGIPLYKVSSDFREPLNQKILHSNSIFKRNEGAQDEIFKKEYYVGKKIVDDGIVSRVKKEVHAKGIIVTYAYSVYFDEFEYSEFPSNIVIVKHKKIRILKFRKEGVEIVLRNGENLTKSWNDLIFSNINYELSIFDIEKSILSSDLILQDKNFKTKKDFDYTEEIFTKYGNLKKITNI